MPQDAGMSDLSDRIETDALKPQSVTADGVSITRRSLADQIAADKYLADKAASADMSRTVKNLFSRIVPPGGH